MMKGNALLTSTCGFLSVHPTVHLAENGDNLTGKLLNGFGPTIHPQLVNLGHWPTNGRSNATQSPYWPRLNYHEANSSCASSLLRIGLQSAA